MHVKWSSGTRIPTGIAVLKQLLHGTLVGLNEPLGNFFEHWSFRLLVVAETSTFKVLELFNSRKTEAMRQLEAQLAMEFQSVASNQIRFTHINIHYAKAPLQI